MGTLLTPKTVNTVSKLFTPQNALRVAKIHPVVRGASIAYDLYQLYRGVTPVRTATSRTVPPVPPVSTSSAVGTQTLPARVRGELSGVDVPRVNPPAAPASSGGLLDVIAKANEQTNLALVEGLNAHAVTTFSGLEMVAQQLESIMLVLANTIPELAESSAKVGAYYDYMMKPKALTDIDGNAMASVSPADASAMADITTAAGNTDENDSDDLLKRLENIIFGDSDVFIPLP